MAQRHKDLIVSLAECMVGPTLKSFAVFSDERHNGITAQRHFNVYRYYICVCMYVSSYVDDAGELKSCKQSSIRKASKEFRQSNERCGRVALDRSIAKPAFEKFAKNLQTHKFFGPGCWPLAQNP